jgi:hypothetical protein
MTEYAIRADGLAKSFGRSLVNELQSVAARIAGADSERAVGLYETFHGRLSRGGRGGRGTKHMRP